MNDLVERLSGKLACWRLYPVTNYKEIISIHILYLSASGRSSNPAPVMTQGDEAHPDIFIIAALLLILL